MVQTKSSPNLIPRGLAVLYLYPDYRHEPLNSN